MRANASYSGKSAGGPRRRHAAYAQHAALDGGTRVEPRGAEHAPLDNVISPEPWLRHAPTYGDGDGGAPVGGWTKRLFDIVFAGGALLALAPFLLLIGLAVRLESKGPAIFKQERGGLNNRVFRIWKFRTMTVTENGSDVVQAVANDPRVTRLGAILRQMSWDELPQLVNVVMGDMSLVGPRPHAVDHDRKFAAIDPTYPQRTQARPGMTGLAQVSGCRGPTETPEKVKARTRHDVAYVQGWSFGRDLNIIWRTVKLLLRWRDDANAL